MLTMFRRNPQSPTIEALYGAIVAQARAPAFYRNYAVPDTLNGRLDLLMLHLALVFERLSQAGKDTTALGQALFDRFCQDMDDHLREQGVSDLKVPKDMHKLGAAFFGRHGTYLKALKLKDMDALKAGLRRNIYADSGGEDGARLAGYAAAAMDRLNAQGSESLLAGDLSWPDPYAIEGVAGRNAQEFPS
jgi:cytochrome b pre-mRNA-processing protein 3